MKDGENGTHNFFCIFLLTQTTAGAILLFEAEKGDMIAMLDGGMS